MSIEKLQRKIDEFTAALDKAGVKYILTIHETESDQAFLGASTDFDGAFDMLVQLAEDEEDDFFRAVIVHAAEYIIGNQPDHQTRRSIN